VRFTTTQDYPAGLDRLWATFGQPTYPQAKYRALGATQVRVLRFEVGARSIEVELERTLPVDPRQLPLWARRFVGTEQTLVHRTAWRRIDATHIDAVLAIEPVGLPVRARGSGGITEVATGTSRLSLSWQVESRLPLLGDRVEQLFAEQVRSALEQDHRFTLDALQAPHPGSG
jgi:hypothetical protein